MYDASRTGRIADVSLQTTKSAPRARELRAELQVPPQALVVRRALLGQAHVRLHDADRRRRGRLRLRVDHVDADRAVHAREGEDSGARRERRYGDLAPLDAREHRLGDREVRRDEHEADARSGRRRRRAALRSGTWWTVAAKYQRKSTG